MQSSLCSFATRGLRSQTFPVDHVPRFAAHSSEVSVPTLAWNAVEANLRGAEAATLHLHRRRPPSRHRSCSQQGHLFPLLPEDQPCTDFKANSSTKMQSTSPKKNAPCPWQRLLSFWTPVPWRATQSAQTASNCTPLCLAASHRPIRHNCSQVKTKEAPRLTMDLAGHPSSASPVALLPASVT